MAPQSRLTVRNLKDVTLVTLSDTSVVAPQVIDSIKRELFELVERFGGRVVLDATDTGERTLPRPLDRRRLGEDPLTELADAYFSIPAVFRRPNSGLYRYLEKELADCSAPGIILRRYLWCDHWHAEAERLRQWSGLPLLELDVNDDPTLAGRLQTMVQSFLETLR